MNRLVVTPIILGLLPGCFLCQDRYTPGEESINLSAESIAEELEDGVVDSTECEALCEHALFGFSVDACSIEAQAADTGDTGDSSDSGDTGDTGDSGGDEYLLTCVGTFERFCKGRRPVGLIRASGKRSETVGAWAADACTMEAASVVAFRRLARDLRRLDAPDELVHAARRSALDEVRHARAMARIARSHEVEPRRPRVRPHKPPTLARLAHQNLVAGCLEETWAALVACHQAQRAADPAVRNAMRSIAVDELRHAELAWAIHAWAGRNSRSGWDRAVAKQRADLTRPTNPALVRQLGLPTGDPGLRLFDSLTEVVRARV